MSTGVRGKTTITTKNTTLEALDHDLYKSSLTPNVVLKIKVPETPDKAFVRGQVYVTVSDSVFQSSSPFRHAVMRSKGNDDFEKEIKSCNSMQQIRDKNEKVDSGMVKEEWGKSVRPVQQIISDRFSRLSLKEENFESVPTVTDDEIDRLKEYIPKLFPGMDPNKLQKEHTSKVPAYNEWKKIHCRETHYTFQVRKCDNINCCSLPSRPLVTLR